MTSHQDAASRKRDGAHARKTSKKAKKRGIRGVVDRSTETVERVHRAIASWPLDALERVDRFEKPVARVRKLQDRSITASYEFVRGVNREVAELVGDRRARLRRGSAGRTARPKTKKVARPEPNKVAQPESATG